MAKMTGRRGITALAIVSILALVGAQSSSAASGSASKSKALTVFLSTDTNIQTLWQTILVPAFIKANRGYKVKVVLDLHGLHDAQTTAKLTSATMRKKDPGYDVMDGGFVTQIAASGLLTKISVKNLPNLKDVPTPVVRAGGGGVPYRGSSVLLAYNTTKVQNPPRTLDDLLAWIKSNPGEFTYNTPDSGGSGQSFVSTVLDKFIPTADRSKMVVDYVPELEKDWDQGFAVLASLNPYVFQKGVYPNGNSQILNLLSTGQITMAPVWSDQFVTGVKNGTIPANISFVQIANPSFTGGAAYLGIPSASPRQAAALKLVNWLLSPAAQALMSDSIAGYPVINLNKLPASVALKFKSADIGNLRPTYFSSMRQDLNKMWSQKVPGK